MYIWEIPGIKEGMLIKCLSTRKLNVPVYTPNKVYVVVRGNMIVGDTGYLVNGVSAEWEVVYLSDLSKEDVL